MVNINVNAQQKSSERERGGEQKNGHAKKRLDGRGNACNTGKRE